MAAGTVDVALAVGSGITVGIWEMLSDMLDTDDVGMLVREDGLIVMSVVGFAGGAADACDPPGADKEAVWVSDPVGSGIGSVLVSVNLGIEIEDNASELASGDDA